MKNQRTWVLVADSGKAQVYRATGDTGAHQAQLVPVAGGTFSREKSDAADHGGRHGEITHNNHKRKAEEFFIEEVLNWLAGPERLVAIDRLIVAAPPRTLGEIRDVMPACLSARLHSEIHADLTKSNIKEIEAQVAACESHTARRA